MVENLPTMQETQVRSLGRVSDSDRRVPAELGQESQASSCLRKGTPLASRAKPLPQAVVLQRRLRRVPVGLLFRPRPSQLL